MANEVIRAPVGREVKIKFQEDVVTFTVTESCGGNNGRWHCVTHSEDLTNQLQKDLHISHGEHELAWVCYVDGNLETP